MNKLIKQAFTLIELLVVIASIGILSGLIIVGMSGMTDKANIAKAQVFSNSLRNSLMMNIVSEWKLDEGTGQSASDSWGKINNGTLGSTAGVDANDPTWITSGCVFGNCLSFDGNDYIQNANSSNIAINSFTITAWFKTISSGDEKIISMGSSGHPIQTMSSLIRVCVNVCSLGATNISDGKWHFVVVVGDQNSVRAYINANTTPDTTQISGSGSMTGIIRIGAVGADGGATSPSLFFNGSIDDVRIFNAVMPASYIKEQYYVGLNSLLSSGQINAKEYSQRINSIAYE